MTLSLVSKIRDSFGVWEISILLNGKMYTYPITSEFAVRKFEVLLRRRRFGKAIKLLNTFLVAGFNSFKEEEANASQG
jgi:hypothetical protein